MKLFNLNLKNKTNRSSFDLSRRNLFSAKAGMLLPVCTIDCLPGDNISIDVNSFTRTATVDTAAYTSFDESYEFYFVPYKLLWRYFDETVTQMYDNRQYTSVGGYNTTQTGIFPWFETEDMLRALNTLCTDASIDNTDFDWSNSGRSAEDIEDTQKKTLHYNFDAQGQNLQLNLLRLLDMLGYGNFYQYAKDVYYIGTTENPYEGVDDSSSTRQEIALKNNIKDFAIYFSPRTGVHAADDARDDTGEVYLGYAGQGDTSTAADSYSTEPIESDFTNQSVLEINYDGDSMTYSPFPLLAYQKIYQDWYRNSQWEEGSAKSYNIDFIGSSPVTERGENYNTAENLNWLTGTTIIETQSTSNSDTGDTIEINNQAVTAVDWAEDNDEDINGKYTGSWWWTLHYKNLPLDPIFGVLPNSQYGNEATVDVDLDVTHASGTTYVTDVDNAEYSILDWRQARAYQKWAEIAESGSQNFSQQLLAHWGVKPSNTEANLSTYIGGTTNNISINEVVNTNFQNDGEATIKGKGVGSGKGKTINFQTKDYGIIMGIYCITPRFVYRTNPVNPVTQHYDYGSFAIPEYDKIGMQTTSMQNATTAFPVITNLASDSAGFKELVNEYLTSEGIYNDEAEDGVTRNLIRYQNTDEGIDTLLFPWVDIIQTISISTDFQNEFGYVPRYTGYKAALDEAHGAFLSGNIPYVALEDDMPSQLGLGTYENWSVGIDPNQFYSIEVNAGVSLPSDNDIESGSYTQTDGTEYTGKFGEFDLYLTQDYTLNSEFTYERFKYKPSMVDSIFGVETNAFLDTDQFFIDAYFKIKAVRNLDYNGMPE